LEPVRPSRACAPPWSLCAPPEPVRPLGACAPLPSLCAPLEPVRPLGACAPLPSLCAPLEPVRPSRACAPPWSLCPRANARHVRASIVYASIPYPYSGPPEPRDAQNAARPMAGALPPPPVLPTRTISSCAAALAGGPATPAAKPAHYLSQTVPYHARKAWGLSTAAHLTAVMTAALSGDPTAL
jgi:hypothetical protein